MDKVALKAHYMVFFIKYLLNFVLLVITPFSIKSEYFQSNLHHDFVAQLLAAFLYSLKIFFLLCCSLSKMMNKFVLHHEFSQHYFGFSVATEEILFPFIDANIKT